WIPILFKPPAYMDLDDLDIKMATYVFAPNKRSDEVLATTNKFSGTRDNFKSLIPKEWVHGDVLDLVATMLTMQEKEIGCQTHWSGILPPSVALKVRHPSSSFPRAPSLQPLFAVTDRGCFLELGIRRLSTLLCFKLCDQPAPPLSRRTALCCPRPWYEKRQMKKIYYPLEGLLALYLGFEWIQTNNILAPIITHGIYSTVILGHGLWKIHDHRRRLQQRIQQLKSEERYSK
ncbi:hypothetical protein S245_015772, partial [Arachis hypogaea]